MGADGDERGGDTTMDSEWKERGTCLHGGNRTRDTQSVLVTEWRSGGGSRQINRQTYTHTHTHDRQANRHGACDRQTPVTHTLTITHTHTKEVGRQRVHRYDICHWQTPVKHAQGQVEKGDMWRSDVTVESLWQRTWRDLTPRRTVRALFTDWRRQATCGGVT